MVEKIKETKDQVLERMEQSIAERGIERMDVAEMGKLADVVKDLAEAEKACWEAEYYRSVTEAMASGYDMGGEPMERRMGYRGQPRDSQGQYTRRGYRPMRYGHGDLIQDIKDAMADADPQEREQMKRKLRKMVEM